MMWVFFIIAIQCLLVCDIKSSLCELHHHHPQIPLPLQTDILYPPSPPLLHIFELIEKNTQDGGEVKVWLEHNGFENNVSRHVICPY